MIMARKAEKVTYENKAEFIGNPESVRVEVIKPHDGLKKGCQFFKPAALARRMADLGYWKLIEIETK